jgi:importin subunit alpha-1
MSSGQPSSGMADDASAAAAAVESTRTKLKELVLNEKELVVGADLKQQILTCGQLLCSPLPEIVLQATVGLRQLLVLNRWDIRQQIIDSPGVLARLVQCLTCHAQPKLQFEAAWCITNLAATAIKQTQALIDCGAIKALVNTLSSNNIDLTEQAAWALGNIAGGPAVHRDAVLEANAITPLLIILSNPKTTISGLRNAMWTVSNLGRGAPAPRYDHIASAVPVVAKLLQHQDQDVCVDACWFLSYACDDTDGKKAAAVCKKPTMLINSLC